LLHISMCFKSLASKMLLKESNKISITEHEIRTTGKVVHNLPVIVP